MIWVTFGTALGLSLLAIPTVRSYSLRNGRVVKPRQDRWHKKPTATMGGIAIFLASLAGLLAGLLVSGGDTGLPWGILAGSAVVFVLGIVDDYRPISPPAKLVGQILAAAVVISLGYTTNFFTPRIPNQIVAEIPNVLLTFVWLVGITNAINLLDNMDGLAGGISLITAGFLAFFFWQAGEQGLFLIALALAGSLLGFLFFNFPPASIFMGDSGSLFLGFTLAVLAIARQPQASNVFAVMGVPTLLFMLPILDTTLVTFTRILRGQSPAEGGRDHTSHRLIAFGFSERQALLVLYGIAIVSGLAGLALESLDYWLSLVVVPILIISLAILVAYLGRLKVVLVAKPKTERTLTRIMLDLTFRRRILEVILDFFLIGVSYYLAVLTGYGFSMTPQVLQSFLQTVPLALTGAYLAFFVFGVYRGIWRYVGMDDLLRYLKAALGSVVVLALVEIFLFRPQVYSPVIFLLFAIFLFLSLAASRSSFRILDLFSVQQEKPGEQRVLILGAGDEGEMAQRWIMMNPHLDYRTVGFVDDDPFMAGRQIHGVQVLGGLDQLDKILEQYRVDGVILTSAAHASDGLEQEILPVCHGRGCWVRNLRLEFELLE
jgi:UDP-GlcNAc:undecaprenyl-phosphate GlcNAc-1-phosphate transferase